MVYDDFDDATGTIVTTGGVGREPQIHQGHLSTYDEWGRGVGGVGAGALERSSASPKARSTYHSRAVFTTTGWWQLSHVIADMDWWTTGEEVYFSYYAKVHTPGASGSDFPRQHKSWVAYGNNEDHLYWTNSYNSPCQNDNRWRTHITQIPQENSMSPVLTATEINGEWVRFESYLKQSAVSTGNGAWHQAVYRPTLPQLHSVTLNNQVMRTKITDGETYYWTFGGAYYDMCDTDPGTVDIDEFYIDSSRARVEIADASTWAARTHSELCVCSSWSGTSITATLNAGYHADNADVWVYVHKSDGTFNSSGFPITLDGGGGASLTIDESATDWSPREVQTNPSFIGKW